MKGYYTLILEQLIIYQQLTFLEIKYNHGVDVY